MALQVESPSERALAAAAVDAHLNHPVDNLTAYPQAKAIRQELQDDLISLLDLQQFN